MTHAVGDVNGVAIDRVYTSLGKKVFHQQLRNVHSKGMPGAAFFWETGSRSMTSIARLELTSPIMESCEESTRADMLAYFRLWLLTVFEDLVALMPGTGAVSAEVVASKVGGGRILCVYESGRTSVLEALRRIGFGDDSLDAHFHDMPIPPGKNSNLMETIETLAEQHSHLLYARDGLRHTSSAVEAKFGNRMFKARTAARVASMFKSSLT